MLRGKMICVGSVGVADASVVGRFIEILSVGGFEFCLCGFFLCRAQLQAGLPKCSRVKGFGFFSVNLVLPQGFLELGGILLFGFIQSR